MNKPPRFAVLDDLTLAQRSSLLILCSLTCCWGFANNTVLLIFASKIGFPMAVAACSIALNWKQIMSLSYYTILLGSVGFAFFRYRSDIVIEPSLTSLYNPDWIDFYLALGLGYALGAFWHHPIRINLIVASAGLASLLPACVMAGYQLRQGNLDMALDSLSLYGEYLGGLVLGAMIHHWMDIFGAKIAIYRKES